MNNRIYKFRAWDKVAKKFLWPWPEGFHILGETTCFDCIGQQLAKREPKGHVLEKLNDVEITQYVGLHDKNGKEIYEGDIITTSRGLKGVIKWGGRSAKFYISCPSASHDSEKQLTMGNRENVIGNIYENPELLKEGL